MSNVDPFGEKKSGFFDGLKWLKAKADQGKARRDAAKTGQFQSQDSEVGFNPSQSLSFRQPQRSHYFGGSENIRKPASVLRTNTFIQLTIAAIVAAIPITLYFSQTDDLEQALVSVGDGGRGGSITERERKKLLNSQNRSVNRNQQAAAGGTGAIGAGVPTETIGDVMNDSALEHAVKHVNPNYVCPMHPDVITNDPNAICPICGMDLVPLEAGGEAGVVKLTPTVINSLGVRTAKARRRTLYRRIDSVGYIDMDETRLRTVSLRTDGWVERLVVKTVGERVTKGQLLLELYSPKLVNAQEEFLQSLKHKNELLISASKERLIALGISPEQIQTLEESGVVEDLVKVYAPQSGIVSELTVREGMYVKPSQNIFNLVDLSSVWLMVDVFERQADWVEIGQRAEATLPFMPGKSWEGQVEYIYPSLDASTRSLKVRLRFDNLNEELKPNMYADVAIFAKPKRKVLAIPREALIRTGNEKRVIVALGEGKFIPMPVSVGMETDSNVEVLTGLAEGDEVVTSSQFLIDSESSLKSALARMAGG
ncbi:efflux RND transporter periplasmic adaptor subunit [Kaarinaea lacus]